MYNDILKNFRFWILPSVILKKMVLSNFSTKEAYHDRQIADSLDFMVEVVSIF